MQGYQGFQGEQGFQGLQGVQGEQGYDGLQGADGEQGFQGEQGLQGELGLQGYYGIQGYDGMQGERGLQGTPGASSFDIWCEYQGIQYSTPAEREHWISVFITSLQGIQGCKGESGSGGSGGGGCGCCTCDKEDNHFSIFERLITHDKETVVFNIITDIFYEIWNSQTVFVDENYNSEYVTYDAVGHTITVSPHNKNIMFIIRYKNMKEGNVLLMSFEIYTQADSYDNTHD